jgi:hypothetical protein
MDSGDKWIQEATKKMKKGALTAQAKAHGETPMEFAKDVLAEPEKFAKKTRKRAQFAVNVNPEKKSNPDVEPKMEAPMEAPKEHKKAKRAPSAWNQLVSKHVKALGKGHFKEALALAKKEYEPHRKVHTKKETKMEEPKMEEKPKRARKAKAPEEPKMEEKPKRVRKAKAPKAPEASSRVRQIELHI